jgi:hypothetical protein
MLRDRMAILSRRLGLATVSNYHPYNALPGILTLGRALLLWPSEGKGCAFADRRLNLNAATRGLNNFFDNAQANTRTVRATFWIDRLENRKNLVMVPWCYPWPIVGDDKSVGIITFLTGNTNVAVGSIMMLNAIADQVRKHLRQEQAVGVENWQGR